MTAPLARAADRLLRRCEITPAGCLEWTGCTNSRGYGVVSLNGTRVLTHRLAYEALAGPIPEGLTIDHLCRNKLCVRPDHLEPVTLEENQRRAGAAVTHCKWGHEYTPENTIVKRRPGGRSIRNCRNCANEQQRARAFTRKYLDRDLSAAEMDEWLMKSALIERESA